MERIRQDLEIVLTTVMPRRRLRVTSVVPIAAGHSGLSYWVDAVDSPVRYVLRLPPPGVRPIGAADVVRQGRIMMALRASGIPVPRVVATSRERLVDGRPFLLTEEVVGESGEVAARRWPARSLAMSAIETLRRVHAVAIPRSGIGEESALGPLDELKRWTQVGRRGAGDLLGETSDLVLLLEEQAPAGGDPALVHGDYHIGNLLFHNGSVVAIVDWEIAQLGTPLLDLATFCTSVLGRRYPAMRLLGTALGVSPSEVVEIYGAAREDVAWYLALASYKCAVILSYNVALHRKRLRHDPIYATEEIEATIRAAVATARKILRQPRAAFDFLSFADDIYSAG